MGALMKGMQSRIEAGQASPSAMAAAAKKALC
jgi:hypothetical protein